MERSGIVIVLCRPSEPGNIGAVCRAMLNSGLHELRLVAPQTGDDAQIRARAVHAAGVWDNARRFDSLRGAVADCSLAIGTTRRRGARRKTITMNPHETALFLKNYPRECRAALVFGSERTGLENDELTLCDMASHIPAHDDFPSLNLAQSVQIYGYELFCTLNDADDTAEQTPKGAWHPLVRRDIEALVQSISDSLALIGFYKHHGREQQEEFFRGIISRAGLSRFEAEYFHTIFAKAARLAKAPATHTPN